MAEEPKEKIWVKPVLIGIAAAVLWIPLTGSDLTGALIAGVAGVGIGHLVLSRIGGRDAGKGGETGSEARQSQQDPATDAPAVRLVEPSPVTEAPATGFAEEAAGGCGGLSRTVCAAFAVAVNTLGFAVATLPRRGTLERNVSAGGRCGGTNAALLHGDVSALSGGSLKL